MTHSDIDRYDHLPEEAFLLILGLGGAAYMTAPTTIMDKPGSPLYPFGEPIVERQTRAQHD